MFTSQSPYVALNQLAASQLNQTLNNVQSIHEGTGIQNGAITPNKLNANATGHSFLEIGRTTLVSSASSISVQSLPAFKYLRIRAIVSATGGTIGPALRFNNDSGNNYTRRASLNGGADATQTSSAQSSSGGGSSSDMLINLNISNVQNKEKLIDGSHVDNSTTGAGTTNGRLLWTGKWVNTSTQINRIDLTNGGTGSYAAGSELIVEGSN